MPVLKSKRRQSKTEFIKVANDIYRETLMMLTKLSARYSRLLASDTMHLAHKILENSMSANSLRPTDLTRAKIRKQYLLEARAATYSLDAVLCVIYEILYQNPEGAFSTKSGSSISSDKAKIKLNSMADNLGNLIDKERKLLTGVLKYDNTQVKLLKTNNEETSKVVESDLISKMDDTVNSTIKSIISDKYSSK